MEKKTIFGKVANYKELHVYQKSEVLVLLTDVFCKRFLPLYGDRRVDQMNMAARCGKQNIVEGCEEGLTSSKMEVNLVNVGRASFQELREDYEDYLKRNNLPVWDKDHPRFDGMVNFCRQNNRWEAYQELASKLSAEEFCNMALSLCHITDKMFDGYLKHLEKRFIEEGGIKERMHAARTGYREGIDRRLR
jgi:four helix bundle suffix protein